MNTTRTWIVGGAVLTAVAIGGTALVVSSTLPPPAASAGPISTTSTTIVTKGNLVDTTLFAGTLGYGQTTTLSAAGGGTITGAAASGTTVKLGEPLYEVDEHPITAFSGTVPVHREMSRGLSGRDVHQLNTSLRALGFGEAPEGLDFTSGTARAVREWQASKGLAATGTVGSSQIAFVDGEVRIAGLIGRVGAPAVGDVLQYTSTARVVTSAVSSRDAGRFPVDQPVSVRLPDGQVTPGKVVSQKSQVGSDAQKAPGGDDDTRVDVLIGLDSTPAGLVAGEQAVDVTLPGKTESGVLSVPISALLVAPDGGYRLERPSTAGSNYVRVTLGFFAQGRVAVSGKGVTEGMKVVVPA